MSTTNGAPARPSRATMAHEPRPADLATRVLSTGQVARVMGVAPRTVQNWLDRGELPGYRLPGGCRARRVLRDELVRFLRARGLPTFGLAAPRRAVALCGLPGALADRLGHALAAGGFDSVVPVPALFELGALCAAAPPGAAVLDLSLGRGACLLAARRLVLLEGCRDCLLIAVAGEDEADAPGLVLPAGPFAAAHVSPVDPALLCERLLSLEDCR